ncbi:hypothetical protein NBRC10512_000821 [Rhodotorula toruloides]|uniref:RHTO0S06e08130g1_1 n=2 Tax=Rhodotorula toruloides TaxID=5286 RepID=A0A061AXL2_RHOTO|nr:uncharacterized protein RHTO_06347 [Rhodotorula toruloides NP11]EMS24343.1 hypothetical protein RHTO_06347 [Rhodotorula toruloides NP11]CDR41949.1 RHTO0S06e08130g1_1 [Rhodotorula toruloides]
MDPFIQPAKLQVLLVPVHPIKRSKFERYVQLIRKFGSIPLAEVPPDRRGERAVFSSSPTTPGTLLFDYLTPTTYAPLHPLAFLSEFQVHRRIQGIIGILDASEYSDKALADAVTAFHASLRDLPKTFATKVYGFDPGEKQLEEARAIQEGEGLVMVPAAGDVSFFLKTVLADFAGDILFEFSNMAAQLESRTSIPTPQETPGASAPFSFTPQKPSAKSLITTYTSTSTPKRTDSPKPSPAPQQPVNLASLGVAPPPQSRTAMGPLGGSTSGNRDGFLYGASIQTNMAVQKEVVPSPPPGAQLVDARSRKRVAGRERKLMGDMWLLSGRLNEAINAYNDAVSLTKAWQDQAWQASALEGLCVALVVQASQPKGSQGQHPPSLVPPRSDSPVPGLHPPDISTFLSAIPDRLSQAISLYEKLLIPLDRPADAPPPDPDRSHPLVYVEACIRCATFLLAVYEAHGSIPQALERLVSPAAAASSASSPPPSSVEQARKARLAALSPSNTVPRSSIALWVSQAYSPHLALLSLPSRLRLTAEIASLFGRIGYRRKEAFVLRELAALCAEGVAGKSIEVFAPSGHSPIPEEPREGANGTPAVVNGFKSSDGRARPSLPRTKTLDRGGSIVRTMSDPAGNESIVRIVEKVCEAFGIQVVPRSQREEADKLSVIQGRTLEIMESGNGAFGWPSLQIGVLKDAIGIAEALPDYQAAIRFTVTALRSLADTMPPHEQYELSQNIPRVFAAATRRGAAFSLEYWGPTQLVMSLEVARLPTNRIPFEHALQDAAPEQAHATGPRNPFLYDPRKQVRAAKARPSLVQNELAEVFVTLQNPFLFELEVQNIELSTSGVPFACDPLSTVIPAGSFHTVRLTGTPREPGTLVIRGCNIRLAGCSSREFLLPIFDAAEEAKQQKAVLLDTSHERIKATGLDAVPSDGHAATAVPSDKPLAEGAKFLECVVVPELPLLWMRPTSLTHGALMLYDGEISTIRIGLENTSPSPVDFVKVTFSDSLSASTQAYLAENELSAPEVYELEADGVHRPVFRWDGSPKMTILPGASHVLEIQCLGKIGCNYGSIQIDYGYLDRGVVQSTKTFHTRQLFCDVFMTVHRAVVARGLELSRLKALPEGSASHSRSASVVSLGQRGAALDKRLEDSLRDVDDGQHCLVAVDVMNVYGKPFEVKLERHEDENGFYQVRQRIEPGATLRMLVRLDRVELTEEQLQRPIPSLTERQFVVAKVKRSTDEERLERALFWYREELLRRVQLRWNEVGSLRSGEVSLRGLALDKQMLDTLRGDEVEIELFLAENPSSSPGTFELQGRGSRLVYSAASNDFIDVRARVTNRCGTPLRLNLRLELRPPDSTRTSPAALSHLARYVVVEGVSPVAMSALESGETAEVIVSICLLAQGTYELSCVVEEAEASEGAATKRVFSAREPLTLHVDR